MPHELLYSLCMFLRNFNRSICEKWSHWASNKRNSYFIKSKYWILLQKAREIAHKSVVLSEG
jgi:hypothetical protein